MRDTRKEPLPGLCPRPQDFRRHISGVRWPAMKTAPDNYHRQRPDASSAHRRPGYPSSGCVPAEPDSVSPGNHTLAPMSTSCKKPSAPEPCLKNPIAPGNGRRAGQKKAEKSKITHTIWRRPRKRYGLRDTRPCSRSEWRHAPRSWQYGFFRFRANQSARHRRRPG